MHDGQFHGLLAFGTVPVMFEVANDDQSDAVCVAEAGFEFVALLLFRHEVGGVSAEGLVVLWFLVFEGYGEGLVVAV